MCLQPLATAACCWRKAACSSWSSFTHTHRPTKTSNCWPRASWRACSATEPAPASLHKHTRVAARHHSNLTEVNTHTLVVSRCISLTTAGNLFILLHFLFQKLMLPDQQEDVSWVPPQRGSLNVCVHIPRTHTLYQESQESKH